eukprot:6594424-Pyramimonas_sp.AAC.1
MCTPNKANPKSHGCDPGSGGPRASQGLEVGPCPCPAWRGSHENPAERDPPLADLIGKELGEEGAKSKSDDEGGDE